MEKVSRSDIKNLFEDISTGVEHLLAQFKYKEIGGSTLYFVDKRGILLLKELKNRLESGFSSNRSTDQKRYNFDLIVKLLNPDAPAQNYSTGIKWKHKQINGQEAVRLAIKGEFAVWCNTIRKEAADLVALHDIQGEELERIERRTTALIKEGESEYEFVDKNFDDLEVRIAGYLHENPYPYITFYVNSQPKSKAINKHLSITVPSVLFYERAKYNSNMSIADFISKGKNAFGDVFYVEKQRV